MYCIFEISVGITYEKYLCSFSMRIHHLLACTVLFIEKYCYFRKHTNSDIDSIIVNLNRYVALFKMLSQSSVDMSLHPESRSLNSPKMETVLADNMKFIVQPRNSSESCAVQIDNQNSVVEITSRGCVPFVQNGQSVRKRKPRKQRRHWFDINAAITKAHKRGISPCERSTSIKKCKLDETVATKILVTLAQVGQHGFNDTQVSSLTTALLKATYERSETFKPRIYNAGYINGRYELFGADFETLNWATSIIPQLKDLWDGANIYITYAGLIPKLIRATILIPGDPVAPETFFSQISWLNGNVNTSMWRIFSRNKIGKGAGEVICFGIDEDSLAVLEKKNFLLFLGLGHLSIRLCKDQ